MGICIYVHMSEGVHESQELVSYARELKLQMVVSCLIKVLRTKLGSFERSNPTAPVSLSLFSLSFQSKKDWSGVSLI